MRLLLLIAISTLLGCSRAPRSPWSEQMPHWFTNAATQPTDPPFTYWTRDERELFLRRIGYADVAAIGIVRAVSSCAHKGNPTKITLAFEPKRMLHGSLDKSLNEEGDLLLTLDEEDLDFRRAVKLGSYLPGRRFLVFFKKQPAKKNHAKGSGWKASLWRPPPKPKPTYRWSLYRPEPALIAHVQALYRLLKKR